MIKGYIFFFVISILLTGCEEEVMNIPSKDSVNSKKQTNVSGYEASADERSGEETYDDEGDTSVKVPEKRKAYFSY